MPGSGNRSAATQANLAGKLLDRVVFLPHFISSLFAIRPGRLVDESPACHLTKPAKQR